MSYRICDKTRQRIIVLMIVQTVSVILFVSLLYDACGFDIWQSNMCWIVLAVIAAVMAAKEDFWKIVFKHICLYIILSFVLAFCLIGSYSFCYPLDKAIGMKEVLRYLLFAATCIPIVVMICNILIKKSYKVLYREKNSDKSKGFEKWHLLIYAAIPFFIGVISMIAFNPCIVSYDAFEVIAEAKGLSPVQEYAGLIYVLWYRLLLSICDSVIFLCIVQVIGFSVVTAFILSHIERKFNFRFLLLVIIWLVFLLLPGNIMMLVTLSKDVCYAIFLLLLMYSMMLIHHKPYVKVNYIIMALSGILVWSIRQSGIVAVVVSFLLGIITFEKKRVYLAAIICSTIGSVVFNGALVKVSGALPVPSGLKYVALYQDILGVYYTNGNISEETGKLVDIGVGNDEGLKNEYTPYWANYDYYYQDLENVKMGRFLKCYVDTFLRNPILMTKTILCRLDMVWDIRPGRDAVESWQWRVENNGGDWTSLVAKRNENGLTRFMNIVGEWSKRFPFKDMAWRVGVWNFLFFIFFIHIKEKRKMVVALPFLGYLIAYVISLGWSHYRYYWVDEMLVFACILYMIGIISYDKIESNIVSF